MRALGSGLLMLALVLPQVAGGDKGGKSGIAVDKEKKTVTLDAKVAPRSLDVPELKGKIFPIEVIASWPHPKGRKAHETVVTLEMKPSEVHKALESLGLKAGKPVVGEAKDPPQGPDLNIYIDVPGPGGEMKRLSMDKVLVDSRTGAAFPKGIKFRFTGSEMIQPDPEKDEKVYGADLMGAFAVIFPVTNQVVMQTSLTMKEEKFMRLETNKKNLPAEGTAVKLVIEVAK